ncbi:MAG: hypothetical protein ACJ786_36305 [Catenulispora sp.]
MSSATSSVRSIRSVLLTIERRWLRAGGHQGALANAHAAVLEGRERAALRAAAYESLTKLGAAAE